MPYLASLLLPPATAAAPLPIGPASDRPFERVVALGIEGQDIVRVVASTDPDDTCATLTADPRHPRGDTVVDVVLTAFPKDGALVWRVSKVDAGAFSPASGARPTSKVHTVDPEGVTRFELEAVLEDTRSLEPPRSINGELVAEPCGRQPAPAGPPASEQPGTLVFGGRPVALRGARLEKKGDDLVLVVSSEPLACDATPPADLVFQMQLDGRWNQANGHWTGGMHQSASYSFPDAEGRTFTVGSPETGIVRIEGHWTGKTSFRNEAIATGPFHALDCR